MATPAHRGALLATRKLQHVRGLASAQVVTDAKAISERTLPQATPAQAKMLDTLTKTRIREIKSLAHNLSFMGPMQQTAAPGVMQLFNPFVARKNIKTGKWRPPVYSLRRQAELAKMAAATNTLDHLPPGPKTSAMKTRLARAKASLQPWEVALVEKTQATVAAPPPTPIAPRVHAAFLKKAERGNTKLHALKSKLSDPRLQVYSDDLAAAQSAVRNKEEELRELISEMQIRKVHAEATDAARLDAFQLKERYFNMPVEWVGKLAEQKKGAELGVRLYANKRRMFKGHLWERMRAQRVQKQAILMRHMAARVARYKEYYKKRRPNPLKPARYTKPPKLPF